MLATHLVEHVDEPSGCALGLAKRILSQHVRYRGISREPLPYHASGWFAVNQVRKHSQLLWMDHANGDSLLQVGVLTYVGPEQEPPAVLLLHVAAAMGNESGVGEVKWQ